jgi:hypothetical protein
MELSRTRTGDLLGAIQGARRVNVQKLGRLSRLEGGAGQSLTRFLGHANDDPLFRFRCGIQQFTRTRAGLSEVVPNRSERRPTETLASTRERERKRRYRVRKRHREKRLLAAAL